MQRTVSSASALLSRWPQRTRTIQRWLPSEMSGGLEDVVATERFLGSPVAPLAGDPPRPGSTLRHFGGSESWRITAVVIVADALLRSLSAVETDLLSGEGREFCRHLMALLSQVRSASQSDRPLLDPPASTWPMPIRRFVAAGIAALTGLSANGAGRDWLPFVNIWRIYEDWLCERLLATAQRVLGPPTGNDGLRLRWDNDRGQVTLLIQPGFSTKGREVLGSRIFSVTSTSLQPDAVLAGLPRGRRIPKLIAIDAKERGEINADELTSEASKYLWGLRLDPGTARSATPFMSGVVLVSPAGGASSSYPHLGKAATMAAAPFGTPNTNPRRQDLSADRLRSWIDTVLTPSSA
jgi:hypothetical protein